jgi:adenine/guanine phosphoribosyltransferase-like PRPP-binding protein
MTYGKIVVQKGKISQFRTNVPLNGISNNISESSGQRPALYFTFSVFWGQINLTLDSLKRGKSLMHVTLSFKELSIIDTKDLIPLLYSNGVLKTNANLTVDINPGLKSLGISFRNIQTYREAEAPQFSISALAMLALLVRRVAESGRNVYILLPGNYRGRRSRLQWLLSHLKFVDLFRESKRPWTNFINFDGDVAQIRHDDIPEETHYIPFQWFDCSWFNLEENQNPYEVEPILSGNQQKQLVDILNTQGFLERDAIDLFVQVLFMELAWNTILHSSPKPGNGHGIIGAQISHYNRKHVKLLEQNLERSINLCIGDFGLGIPYTLREYYNKSGKNYEADYGCSISSAIVRCAIEPASTCRTDFPSKSYSEGHRGLARIADSMRPSGKIAAGKLFIASSGGALLLEGHDPVVRPIVDDGFAGTPIPGTFVSARLSLRRDMGRPTILSGLPTSQKPDIFLIPTLGMKEKKIYLGKEKFDLSTFHNFCVLDIGYADIDARHVEVLVKEITQKSTSRAFIILWNVRSQWNQMEHIITWWKSFDKPNKPTIAMVRGPNELALLLTGNLHEKHTSLYESFFIKKEEPLSVKDDLISNNSFRYNLNIDAYTEINTLINTNYLAEGFKKEGKREGFFSGKIHLLGGRVVDQFFSVARNSSDTTRIIRWVNTCAAGILQVIAKTKVSIDDLVVLGLAGSIKDILVQAWTTLGIDIPAYTLMTYDVPTKEELSVNIGERNNVIVVVDVISSASLLQETTRVIKRLGKEVIGIVALVDGRERRRENLLTTAIHVFGSSLRVIKEKQLGLAPEYWVDPISLVPIPTQIFTTSLDPRIDNTLKVVGSSNAIRAGHIVDGQRHLSTYIDIPILLKEKREWLGRRVLEECTLKLKSRKWKNFSPKAVLHPSGISRIETVIKPSELNKETIVYQTAVKQFLPILQQIWPNMHPVEIARAFDPGGQPRCARSLELAGAKDLIKGDVVVADDCLYTGRATSQLIQLAVSLGAQRILVVPLIARLTQEQLEHWESLYTISFQQNNLTEICYVFPLFLPIPQYTASECPYEMTEKRLQRWKGVSLPLEKEEIIALKQIEAQPPNRSRGHTQEYAETWLRIRTFAELASEHQTALEFLNNELKIKKKPNVRLAVLTLFLEEWNLLGRARLRQSTRPLLRQFAIDALLERDATLEERLMACSLIRSFYPETFVEYLPYVYNYLEKDINFLGRLILHISSLPTDLRRSKNSVDFLKHTVSKTSIFQKTFGSSQEERLAGLLRVSQQLLISDLPLLSMKVTKRRATLFLFELLSKDPSLTHDASSITEVISSGRGLLEFTGDTFKRLTSRWQEHYERLFRSNIIPLLLKIEPLVLLTMSLDSPLVSKESEYFTNPTSPHSLLATDLGAFSWGLKALSDDPKRNIYLDTITNSAKRIHDNILKTNSLLSQTLNMMRGPVIKEFLDNIESEIRETILLYSLPQIDISGIETIELGRYIFCPKEIVRRGITTIINNLRKHAFKESSTDHPRINIEISTINIDSDPGISVKIYDNGEPLKEPVIESYASKRAAEDIRHFEGDLHQPACSSSSDWSVVQQLDFKLW